MRQPTRPFITAYKGRSSKSRTANPWKIEETENADGNPSPKEPSASAYHEIERDPSYLAALDAADAVFGGKAVELPLIPPGRQGRVLPNLLQDEAISAPPASAESTKARRVRRPAKVAEAVRAEPKKAKPRTVAVAPAPPVQRAKEREPAAVVPDRSSRSRRTIQKKWVWKTELKAGENWKRRLSRFAR